MRRILLLLACCCGFIARAQYVPGDLPAVPSPSAASLGQFGEVPVSFYTGLPVVEVPLYTLQDQGITVPISLRYHASGFRPDQHPGWVGMGWALDAGGVISRVINDMPDEDTWNESCTGCSPGYYYTGKTLANTNFTNLGNSERYNIINNGELYDTEPDEFSFSFGGYSGTFYWDPQASQWRAKCDQAIKVITDPAGLLLPVPFTPPTESGYLANSNTNQHRTYRKTFRGFTIITDDGTAYSFGGSTNNIEYSVGLFAQLFNRWTANSWYLTKITHPDGGVINFTYAPGNFICQYYLSQTSSAVSMRFYNGARGDFSCDVSNVNGGGESGPPSFGFGGGKKAYTGSLIRPVYLSTITSTNATITLASGTSTELRFEGNEAPGGLGDGFFNYRYSQLYPYWGQQPISWRYLPFLQPTGTTTSTTDLGNAIANLQWRKLVFMFINVANQPSRTINFTYNDNPNERLMLRSVQENGSRPYRFDYNVSGNGYPDLPGYFADKTDHWGFYNNRQWVTPSRANMDNGTYYASREPAADTTTALLGMLRRITYPTGGSTDFRFEQHSFAKQLSEDRSQVLLGTPTGSNQAPVGGVRLRASKSYSPDNVASGVYKEYFYVQGYSPTVASPRTALASSGVLGGQSKYWFNKCYTDEANTYTFDVCQVAFSSQSVLAGCTNSKGSHIGYSEVVEKQRGGGYTRYKFSNFDAGVYTYAANAPQLDEPAQYMTGTWASQSPFSSHEQDRGLLLAEEVYNEANQLVKNRQLGYSSTFVGEFVPAVKSFGFFPCPQGVGQEYRIGNFAYYKRFTYSWLPYLDRTTLYDVRGQNPVATSTYKYYNYTRQLASTYTSRSDGSTNVNYTYPSDYSYAGSLPYAGGARAISLMQSRNILNKPISMTEYRVTGCCSYQLANATVATYTVNDNDVVVPAEVLQLNPAQAGTSTYTTPYYDTASGSVQLLTDSKLQSALIFNEYGTKVNPGRVLKPGGQMTTHLWDYGRRLPVARVENADPSQTGYTSFEADGPTYTNDSYQSAGPYELNYDPRLGQSTHLQAGGGVSGRRSYLLDGGWGVSRNNIPPGDYEVTFWAKGGWNNVYLFIDSNSQLLGQYDEYTSPQDFHLLRGRVRIGGNGRNYTGSFNIDAYGRQVNIDDVRLYPVGASMTTTTYDPLVGVTSTSDANSRPVLYEYDNLSRLQLLRNQDRDVVKTYEYNLKP